MKRIETTKIILHCSDSDSPAHDDISIIKRWHRERGFIDVGYHFFITRHGRVQTGRHIDDIGAHCKGENKHSVGICVHGRDTITDYQLKILKRLINNILLHYALEWDSVFLHSDFSSKTCPNFSMERLLAI